MAHFVFVHGAFGGAWCWEPVIGPLEEAGHTVEAPDLPGGGDDQTPVEGITLASCAERVGAALARSPEPAVLVGYSMGGVVITQAAGTWPEQVASMIFVAAFMPSNGQSLLDLARLPESRDLIQANLVVEGDPPVATLSDEGAAVAVYNRCTPEQATAAAARRRPQAVAPFATPASVDDAVLASIPRSYVLTMHDNALAPALQRRMISEHPCRRVIEIAGDHAPFYSATDELVAALLELARV
jgi:pimeloyl-ACP methyl ester carboxylesterase